MEGNGKYISVTEAAESTGKHITTIYKAIRRGQLTTIDVLENFKTVKKVLKSDVVGIYGNGSKGDYRQTIENTKSTIDDQESTIDIKDQMKEVIEEYFQDKEAKLMRPIEEMAVYKLGKLENEIQHLKAEKELILLENTELRENLKALPGPISEITAKLESQEKTIQTLQKQNIEIVEEKESIQRDKDEAIEVIKKETSLAIHNVEQEKVQLLNEKETALKEKEKTLQQLQKEKEELQEAQAQKEKELQEQLKEQKEKAEQEEKDLLATLEEMKKRLEEEKHKPWWKKIFG